MNPITITASAEGTLIEVNGQEIFIKTPVADLGYDPSFALTAAIADPARSWDASGAQSRVIAHCEGKPDSCWKRAYLVPGATPSASKFPVYDVVDGELTLIPRALIAAAGRIGQAKGVDTGGLKSKICSLYGQVRSKYSDFPECPLSESDSKEAAASKSDDDDAEPTSYRTAAATIERAQVGRYSVPVNPPSEWFMPPTQDSAIGPMPLTITREGKVMGHGATWDSCHAGYPDRCVPVPRSAQDYKFFHRGAVQAEDGVLMAVGHLTVGGGHASPDGSLKAAAEHYDNASSTVAVVAAYEDRWGIYLAGSLVADTTPEKVAMLLRSPLSGDWRNFEGSLELVAMHGVNVPGFGVDRPRVSVAAAIEGDVPNSLVIVGCAQCQDEDEKVNLDSRIAAAASILEGKE